MQGVGVVGQGNVSNELRPFYDFVPPVSLVILERT